MAKVLRLAASIVAKEFGFALLTPRFYRGALGILQVASAARKIPRTILVRIPL